MITKEWAAFLFDLYKKYRKFPGWNDLFSCHDEEDKDYFQMLDYKGVKSNDYTGD